jgi:hypothetical protein
VGSEGNASNWKAASHVQPRCPRPPAFDVAAASSNYDRANAATETEAVEILKKAEEFRDLVEKWTRKHLILNDIAHFHR